MRLLVFLVLVVLVASVPMAGARLAYYGIEDTINEDLSVSNEIVLQFKEPVNHLDYRLNFEITDLTAKANFDSADCVVVEGNTISCDFVGMTEQKNMLTLNFVTEEAVKKVDGKFRFSANYGFLPTDKIFVLIRLPQSAVLSEEVVNESYFPRDGGILSDGKHIMVFWEESDVESKSQQFSVSYAFPLGIPSYVIISLTIIVIIAMVGVVVYARKKQKPVEVVTSVLNQDEKTIADILQRNEGRALQKVLVKDSGFSKAKVSRLVKDMKSRGMVEIEPVSGRENRIRLIVGESREGPGQEPGKGKAD